MCCRARVLNCVVSVVPYYRQLCVSLLPQAEMDALLEKLLEYSFDLVKLRLVGGVYDQRVKALEAQVRQCRTKLARKLSLAAFFRRLSEVE